MTDIITDAKGRKLVVNDYNPGIGLDVAEASEGKGSDFGFFSHALPAFLVSEIDGVPLPRPTSKADIRANLVQIGVDGLSAITGRRKAGAQPDVLDAAGN